MPSFEAFCLNTQLEFGLRYHSAVVPGRIFWSLDHSRNENLGAYIPLEKGRLWAQKRNVDMLSDGNCEPLNFMPMSYFAIITKM